MKTTRTFIACMTLLFGLSGLALIAPVNMAAAQITLDDQFKKSLEELFKNSPLAPPSTPQADNQQVPNSREQITLSYAPLVKRAAPSVVNVYAARTVQQRSSPFSGDPFFERFFGNRGLQDPFGSPRKRIQRSLGSGVIVSVKGTVLTNFHVIEGADEVKIALADGSEFDADIILLDKKSDLAVLQIRDDVNLPAIEIADSDNVEVGDLVLAIGNPFGVGQTVTSGIVSAVARSRVGINDFGFFIQTDASINPGNSGGALIDMQGRLIGINTAIYTRSGGSNGIGFAVPSNMASVVVRTASSGEQRVSRPWLGADFQSVTSDIAESLGMKRPGGVLVASIVEEGPAYQAGLRTGDVIIGINKNIIENADALGYRLDTIGIGGQAELVVISSGERKVLNVQLKKPPESTPRNETLLDAAGVLGGAVIANLSPAVAQDLGVSASLEGVVVTSVERRSHASQNGVKKGDIILQINQQKINKVSQIVSTTSRRSSQGWRVILLRGNREIIFERKGGFFRQYAR